MENTKVGIGTEKNPKELNSTLEINNKIERLNWMIYVVILFVVLGFLGILVSCFAVLSDNWRHKEDVYYQLLEKVNQNNCGFIKIN